MDALDEVEEKLLAIVSREGLIDRSKLSPDATLDSLGISSADVIVILMAVEEEFGAYIPVDGPLSDARTVGEFVAVLRPQLTNPKS